MAPMDTRSADRYGLLECKSSLSLSAVFGANVRRLRRASRITVMLAWRSFAASRTLCPLGVGEPIAVDGDCRGFDCEMAVPPIVFLGNRALFQLPSLLLGLYSCGINKTL